MVAKNNFFLITIVSLAVIAFSHSADATSKRCRTAASPAAPTNLRGTASVNSIVLSWGPSSTSGVSYLVSRNATQIANVGSALTYNDNGLATSTLYNYSVVALNSCNKKSQAATLSISTLAATPIPTPSGPAAVRAYDFLNSLGINVQLASTASAYGNMNLMQSELNYIGIKNLRDMSPAGDWLIPNYKTLVNAGFKFDFIIGRNPNEQMNSSYIQTELAMIKQVGSAIPGSINGLEGLNEPYNFPNFWNGILTNNWTTVFQVQQAEWNTVKADPFFAGIPLLNTSSDYTSFAGTPPNFAPYADLANGHVYPYSGMQPKMLMDEFIASQGRLVPNKQMWFTEFGYGTQPLESNYGVDEATQAKNITTGLFHAFTAGVKRTYIYFLNQYTDSSSNPWDLNGIFTSTGNAKSAAHALHNVTTVLADSGANASSFAPQPHGFTISGLPSSGGSLVMQKSDGTFNVALWNTANNWNPGTHSQLAVSPSTVTINLGGTFSSVRVYDSMVGTNAIATYSNVSSVQVELTDHPIIVQVKK